MRKFDSAHHIATETRTSLPGTPPLHSPRPAPDPPPPRHPHVPASSSITRPQNPRRGDRHGDYPNSHAILGRICLRELNIARLQNSCRSIYCCCGFMGFKMPRIFFEALWLEADTYTPTIVHCTFPCSIYMSEYLCKLVVLSYACVLTFSSRSRLPATLGTVEMCT
jgi:hypothetical protein